MTITFAAHAGSVGARVAPAVSAAAPFTNVRLPMLNLVIFSPPLKVLFFSRLWNSCAVLIGDEMGACRGPAGDHMGACFRLECLAGPVLQLHRNQVLIGQPEFDFGERAEIGDPFHLPLKAVIEAGRLGAETDALGADAEQRAVGGAVDRLR